MLVNKPKPDIDTRISTFPLIRLYDNDYHLQKPEADPRLQAKINSWLRLPKLVNTNLSIVLIAQSTSGPTRSRNH